MAAPGALWTCLNAIWTQASVVNDARKSEQILRIVTKCFGEINKITLSAKQVPTLENKDTERAGQIVCAPQTSYIVTGAKSQKGLVVRVGTEISTKSLGMRLAVGAVITVECVYGDRLCYVKVSGDGPSCGWISTQIDGVPTLQQNTGIAPNASPARRRRSPSPVRRPQSGSIMPWGATITTTKTGTALDASPVRRSRTPSPEHQSLSGSIVPRARSNSPLVGPKLQDDAQHLEPLVRKSTLSGKTVRILALHGLGANARVMEFQMAHLRAQLQRVLGDLAEWHFLTGKFEIQAERVQAINGLMGHEESHFAAMQTLSDGMPLCGWSKWHSGNFDQLWHDTSGHGLWTSIDEVFRYMTNHGPFDVVIGFSQGCAVANFVAAHCRERGFKRPWSLSINFNADGSAEQLSDILASRPLHIPAIFVSSPKDPVYEMSHQLKALFKDYVILEHDEGHKTPSRAPRADEIFEELVSHIRLRCRLLID